MKSLIFDSGPIISLATNNLLWILEPLKESFKGEFFITGAVKKEVVNKPLETKKFKFEAIQVEKLIETGILKVHEQNKIHEDAKRLLEIANQTYKAFDNYIQIVHFAEMEVVAAALDMGSNAIAIDEKTTRHLIESPSTLGNILERTLHTNIKVNENNLKEFREKTANIRTIRSVELVSVAFEKKILDRFLTKLPKARQDLLESVLWGVKLNGCAVSSEEIEQIMKIEQ